MGSANVQPVVNGQVPRWRVHSAIRIGIDLSPMKLTVKKEWPSIPSDSFLLQTASLQDGTLLALCPAKPVGVLDLASRRRTDFNRPLSASAVTVTLAMAMNE